MRLKKKTFSKQASVVGAGVGAARVGTGVEVDVGVVVAVGVEVDVGVVVAAAANWSERQLKINAFVPRKLNLLLCQKLFKLELMLSHKKLEGLSRYNYNQYMVVNEISQIIEKK